MQEDEMLPEYDLAALPTVLRGPGFRNRRPLSGWAVCLCPADEPSLVARKLYQVSASPSPHKIRVINEAGESALYPAVWFMPVELPKSDEARLLTEVA